MTEEIESAPPPTNTPNVSFCDNLRKRFPVTVEPIVFFVFFGEAVASGYMVNLLIDRICSVIYELPDSVCLDPNPETEHLVQPYTTKISMYMSLVDAIISGVSTMFVGPWSDSNGRKPFIVFSAAGLTLNHIGWFIIAHLPTAHPLWFMLPSIFLSLPGGIVSLFTCVFCYVSDVTEEDNRAFRLTIATSMISVGFIGGNLLSSYIYSTMPHYASTILLGVASGSSFISLIYTVLILPESLDLRETERASFFSSKSVADVFRSLFEERPDKGRARLLLIIVITGIFIFVSEGEIPYRYYALRKSFLWTLDHFNIYLTIICGVTVLVESVGVYITSSLLKINDLYVALISTVLIVISSILSALSKTSLEYYIFSAIGCFGSLMNPMLQTELTKYLPKNDLGKVYVFISLIEAFSPLIASPLYRTVYNDVLDYQPLAFLYLSAGLWILSLILMIALIWIQCGTPKNSYSVLASEENLEDALEGPLSNGIS